MVSLQTGDTSRNRTLFNVFILLPWFLVHIFIFIILFSSNYEISLILYYIIISFALFSYSLLNVMFYMILKNAGLIHFKFNLSISISFSYANYMLIGNFFLDDIYFVSTSDPTTNYTYHTTLLENLSSCAWGNSFYKYVITDMSSL